MYSFDSRVRYSEVDFEQKITLSSILDYFQDCSTFHSEDIGIGLDYLKERNAAWILSSWQVGVTRYPKYGERIKISTWAYDCKGFYGYRNFTIQDESETIVAYANSLWVFMDVEKQRPCRIFPEVIETYQYEPQLSMECESRKIKVPVELTQEKPFDVQRFHIDTNMHVNNEKYVLMAQEYLPSGFQIEQMRAEYKKSAVFGDRIYPGVCQLDGRILVVLAEEQGKPYAVIEFKGKENV